MPDLREKALGYIKQYGPVIPVQLSKELHTDILMAGAILSELVANKMVKITSVKRGGSPFYYTSGQEYKLQNLKEHLHEKEQEAYSLLSKEKVVKDKDVGPVLRVALRALKDYAIPITVTSRNGEELFWRWYLSSEQDVKKRVELLLTDAVQEEKKEEIQTISYPQGEPQEKRIPLVQKEVIKEKPLPVREEKKILKPVEKPFDNLVRAYFTKHDFSIVVEESVRKNREHSYVARIPSQIGKLDFYVKIKNKKVITPTDLSLAYSEGQLKKLPVLFISNGVLTKKAQENLVKQFKGQVFFRTL